jgi:ABC-type branched-subunit amino acid transport system permease subunit
MHSHRTPLGRMLNAVRDNPERVEFVGYNTQRIRYTAFIIAGFFAGISGGLGALNFEIVTAEVVHAARSGAYLLFTFLGGATFFFGPILGAILMVLAFVLFSEFTKAWLLYLGLDIPVYGDVCARRICQPDHDESARCALVSCAALEKLSGACRTAFCRAAGARPWWK